MNGRSTAPAVGTCVILVLVAVNAGSAQGVNRPAGKRGSGADAVRDTAAVQAAVGPGLRVRRYIVARVMARDASSAATLAVPIVSGVVGAGAGAFCSQVRRSSVIARQKRRTMWSEL